MKILSEKCDLTEDEVRESYEEFLLQHPEGEISKEEFVGSMKVRTDERCEANIKFAWKYLE